MTNDQKEIIKKLKDLNNLNNSGPIMRLTLNLISGFIPLAGGVFSGASAYWGETDQNEFNSKITDLIESNNVDIDKINEILDNLTKEPSFKDLIFLLNETLNLKELDDYKKEGLNIILNPLTINEFKQFETIGLIKLISNGNIMSLGAGNIIGDSIEDIKRDYGLGNGYILVFTDLFYKTLTQ